MKNVDDLKEPFKNYWLRLKNNLGISAIMAFFGFILLAIHRLFK